MHPSLLSALLVQAAPVCDICNGGLLNSTAVAGYATDDEPYTCQEAQQFAWDARPGDEGFQNCSGFQASSWLGLGFARVGMGLAPVLAPYPSPIALTPGP